MVFGNTLFLKNWIRSTETKWNPSRKCSQYSLHCKFSTRFKRPWFLNFGVDPSNSKEGSSSCQCTMTLIGENEEQRKLYCECSQSYWVCSKIDARKLVVSGAWIGRVMVRNPCQQTWWRMGENCWSHDAQLLPKVDILYSVLAAP